MKSANPEFGRVPLSRLLRGGGTRLRGLYLTSMSAWSVVYGLPLVTGALIALLLDRATTRPVPDEVWSLLAWIVGLMLLRAATLPFSLQLTFKLIFKMSAWIKVHVLGGLLDRSGERAPALGHGELLNRLRDDSDEIGGLLEWTTDLIYRFVLAVAAVVVLLVTDAVMTIPLVLLLGGLAASVALKKRVSLAQTQTRLRQGRIGASITDTLNGIRDLRLADALEGRLDALGARFADRRRYQIRHQLYTDLLSDLFRNLVTISTAVILLTMSLSLGDSRFTVGRLTLFLTYSSWLGQQMYFFGKILARYQGGVISYGRLVELAPPQDPDATSSAPAPSVGPLRELTVTGLSYRLGDRDAATEPVSLTVRPGELVAITGELGGGKSTLIRSLLGLQPDIVGEVLWNGEDVTGDTRVMRAPRVGYARQAPKFLRGTIRDNLVLGSDVAPELVERALEAVDLRPGSAELPLGLETRLDSGDAGQLSGGQRQRLALARMLCRPAELYIVDDCDSSLDADTARELWRRLPQAWAGAWIVVSHNPDLLAAANRVVTVGRRLAAPTAVPELGLRGVVIFADHSGVREAEHFRHSGRYDVRRGG